MSRHSRTALFSAAGLLLAVLPALAKPKAAPKLVPVQTAVIENTGSTNTTGYQITVSSDKSAKIATDIEGHHMTMTYAVGRFPYTDKLFQDLNAALPLSALPVRHGMRSASFGTETFITYKSQRSPDLTFASDPRTAALKADIDNITKWLGVKNVPRRPIVMQPIVIHADKE